MLHTLLISGLARRAGGMHLAAVLPDGPLGEPDAYELVQVAVSKGTEAAVDGGRATAAATAHGTAKEHGVERKVPFEASGQGGLIGSTLDVREDSCTCHRVCRDVLLGHIRQHGTRVPQTVEHLNRVDCREITGTHVRRRRGWGVGGLLVGRAARGGVSSSLLTLPSRRLIALTRRRLLRLALCALSLGAACTFRSRRGGSRTGSLSCRTLSLTLGTQLGLTRRSRLSGSTPIGLARGIGLLASAALRGSALGRLLLLLLLSLSHALGADVGRGGSLGLLISPVALAGAPALGGGR